MRTADRRRRQSNALLLVGAPASFVGLGAAVSGLGPIILAVVPLPVTGAAALMPARWRWAAALVVWGCWCFGLYHVLS